MALMMMLMVLAMLVNILEIAMLATTLDHFLSDHPEPWRSLRASLGANSNQRTKFATRCEGHCCILLQYHCHGSGGPWSWPSPWPGFLIESGYRKGHVLSVFYGSRCFVYGNTPAIYGILYGLLAYQICNKNGGCPPAIAGGSIPCPYDVLTISLAFPYVPLAHQICNKM